MIEFTIKTLDANDYQFSVDDETTVEQLKEKILEQMGVEIDLQRLIFCGRVLQDSKKLAEYGVHGKVIHMVQRAPPCLEEREVAREREQENNIPMQPMGPDVPNFGPINFNHISPQQMRRLMALAASATGIEIEETPAHDLSPTASRLEFLRRLIIEIRTSLDALRDNESDIDRGFGATREGRGQRIRSMRPNYHTPPRDFGLLVEELHELDDEFALFRELYINSLREASDPDIHVSEEMLQRRQRTADLCAELYHSFSHAYHSVSDVGLLLGHSNSRLTSEALMRHPLPVQAQINVMPPSPPPPAAENAPVENAPLDGEDAPLALPGRTITPPTVNINIRSDPVSYQFEIETTVPIPVAVQNADPNGTNTIRVENSEPSTQPAQDDEQPDQEELSDRRQVMMEFENLFRGLRQSGRLGGVEVVMSMEEIVHVNGGVNNSEGASAAAQSTEAGGNPPNVVEPQTYMAQTADFLHEIVTSVIRQGLIPGVNELFHAQDVEGPSQSNTTQPQGSAQPHPQSQFLLHQFSQPIQLQTQPQSELRNQTDENQTQAQNLSQIPHQTTGQDRSQRAQSSNEQNANSNSNNEQTQTALHEAVPRIRTQTVSIFDLVYDRFLQCDSQHARHQLQLRRDESMQRGGLRLRDAPTNRIQNNVETLFERFNRYTLDDESLMIAGTVLLREATSFSTGRTLEPHELAPLRHRMQVYMRLLMQGEYEEGTQEQLADLIFEQNAAFLYRIHQITPIRPNIDVISSMRAVFVRFLNEAMIVLDIVDIEVFSRRCRIIYPRMFYELCGVISYCSLEGPAGLTMIYRSFVTDLIQHIDEPVRDLLYSLSIENLNTALARVTANKIHYPQFIRRLNQPSCSASSSEASCSFGPPTCDASSGSSIAPMDVEMPSSDGGNQSDTDSTLPMEFTSELDETLVLSSDNENDNDMDLLDATLIASELSILTPEKPAQETPRTSSYLAKVCGEGSSASGTGINDQQTAQNRGGFREERLDDSESTQENEDNVESSSDMATLSSAGETPDMSQDDNDKSRIAMVDDLATWSEPASNHVDADIDSRCSLPYFTNLLKFRRELFRYPDALEKAQAVLGGSPHRSTPSPPLENVIVDHPSGRRNYVGGIFRREMSHALLAQLFNAGSASSSAPTLRAIEAPRGPDVNDACASDMQDSSRCRSRRPRSKSPDSPDPASFVPPAQIAQYWGDQWVPTFTRDLQQQCQKDEPYSDAYLSGMPPKKRRCVRQARPPQEPNVLVQESLQDLALWPGVPRRGDTISSAFRDHLRRYLSTHSVASQNYDPRLHKSAARFLTYTRKNKKTKPGKSKQ